MAGALLTVVLIFAAVYFYITPLANAVNKMINMTDSIARGDLTVSGDGMKKERFNEKLGELYFLGINVGKMVKGMTKYIKEVKTNTDNLDGAIKNITKSIAYVSAGSQEQAVQTQQVLEAVNKLSEMSGESLRNAAEAAKASELTKQTTQEGEKSLKCVLDGMKVISEKMGALSEQTARIGEILSVIENIADQTNLLSLNAAIEAARAGEQGRGFAVVAEEVRKLAASSAESTREISTLVAAIRVSTTEAVAAVNEGALLSGSAEKAFGQIRELINSNSEMVKLIEAASREQAANAEKVVEGISSIASVSQEASACAEETSASAQEVGSLAVNLKAVVNVFKI